MKALLIEPFENFDAGSVHDVTIVFDDSSPWAYWVYFDGISTRYGPLRALLCRFRNLDGSDIVPMYGVEGRFKGNTNE